MIELESERLRLRELSADNLEPMMTVHLSNPDFLAYMEGSEGEAGRYDLERWQRDWFVAQMMPTWANPGWVSSAYTALIITKGWVLKRSIA